MKRVVAVLAVVAAGLLIVGVASARVPTTINFSEFLGADSTDILAVGSIDSPKAKCKSGRTVKFFVFRILMKQRGPVETRQLVDIDRSSHFGAWAVRGDILGATGGEISVTKKKLGHGQGSCAAAKRLLKFS
jgi:hypothetical protein